MSLARRSRLFALLGGFAVVASGLSPVISAGAVTAPGAPVTIGVPTDVWARVSEAPRRSLNGDLRRVNPSDYAAYHLDLGALQHRLSAAPSETARRGIPATIQVPSPTGELVEFAIEESPVMEPALAARHPEIHTYAGKSTGEVPASIRLDVTPMGFHAAVRGAGGGAWYVDPAYNGIDQGADALYLSYLGESLPADQAPLVEPELSREALQRVAAVQHKTVASPSIGEGGGAVAIQRTYRLALVSDPSYATYFSNSSDDGVVSPIVTAEKVTLMNRVNEVYGDDLSVKMILVNNNDQLNFDTATQFTGTNGRCGQLACYTAADIGCGQVIDTNRYVVGQIIGAENFDIGHIMFGPDGDGGGVAYLGAVGTTIKAGGCTGLNPPTGDGFAIDYVAHEMGHQFAGNHTFDGTTGSCSGGNRNAGTSVEPGSGITVMAYAGICGVDNLQPHSDPYFSERSQQEIAAFTRSAPNGVSEVQNIALSSFDNTDSFTLSFAGNSTITIANGTNYTSAAIKTAVQNAEPSAATAAVTGYWGRSGSLANGFQITWSGTSDIATPVLNSTSGVFTSIVGTTDNGGLETNQGFNNPAPTGNHNPTVTAPAAKTIPQQTPFQLTGSATDADGDSLVYLWEQNDAGAVVGTGLNDNTKLTGPLFRVFGTYANVSAAGSHTYQSPGLNLAGTSPTRSFPDLAQVVAGTTNAATGSCPTFNGTGSMGAGATLDCYSEFLPTAARTMHFRLTARDLGGANGGSDGGTAYADVTITVDPLLGPFQVTSQGTATPVSGATAGTVTWTSGMTSLAANVKISMSTDGGVTFPTVLAASTPNDGTASVVWPNVATSQGRIKVEAVGNYFYDVNDAAITITPSADTTPPQTTITAGPSGGKMVLAKDITFSYDAEPGATYTCSLRGVTTDCTAGKTFVAHSLAGGTYEFSVAAKDAAGNVDPTPAKRRFYVPVNDRKMQIASGPWQRRSAVKAFRGTYTQVAKKGAVLTYRVTGATSIGVVVTRGPGYGAFDLYLGTKFLRTITNSQSTQKFQVLSTFSALSAPTSGVVRIVTRDGHQVRIEGLAVRTQAVSPPLAARGLPEVF